MDTAKVRRQILALERERQALLPLVLRPGPMVSGGLVERWIVCGKEGCRCQSGERHGPYYYRSVLKSGKPRLEYIGKDEEPDVPLLKRYQDYQRRMARLNAVHREMVELLWQLAEQKIRKPQGKRGAK